MRAAFLIFALTVIAPRVLGQLAITEAMSSASTDPVSGKQRPDFWELTNFGTNAIALENYRFSDDSGVGGWDENAGLFAGKYISPRESIIFFRAVDGGIKTPAQFRNWWGEANLPANGQIYAYRSPGLNDQNDSVQLYHVTTISTTLVDRAVFYEARRACTFTYDITTGDFGLYSIAGEHAAFRAAEGGDVGSPGFTAGPVPLAITLQPQAGEVDAGAAAIFKVEYRGLPKPRIQWHRDWLPISSATYPSLTIFPTLQSDAGTYSVHLENGLTNLVSSSVMLAVSTNPSCARIIAPPADTMVFTGQTAIFRASIRGYPLPAVQWRFSGTNIPGATNTTLRVAGAQFGSTGDYTIEVRNDLCTNKATVHLNVTSKPFLAVTEAMPDASPNSTFQHSDWWELTNFDTNALNLKGYRFNDLPGPSLEGTYVITNDVIVQPGESIIFARQMSKEVFVSWWGEENLPENIQILTYSSHNFEPTWDGIFLWNPAALDRDEFLVGVNFVSIATGVTLWFDPFDENIGRYGAESVLGQRGAIQALDGDDIGSPGWIADHPSRVHLPRLNKIQRAIDGVTLTWSSRPGKRYELQYKNSLSDPAWTPLGEQSADGLSLTTTDPTATGASQRFYRLLVLPSTP